MSVILMDNQNESGKNYYVELLEGNYTVTTDPQRAREFKNIAKAQGAMNAFPKILRKYAWFPVYTEAITKKKTKNENVHNENIIEDDTNYIDINDNIQLDIDEQKITNE